ncbi:hypothetical protein, partial [Prescottella equi]|uniref:hypothetical protein n=1 Tax=Rhodococcus hoagii TaxID=43767 RepID=UPI0016428E5D
MAVEVVGWGDGVEGKGEEEEVLEVVEGLVVVGWGVGEVEGEAEEVWVGRVMFGGEGVEGGGEKGEWGVLEVMVELLEGG